MIKIITRLNDGIYKSEGGGQEITHYEWENGPRNMVRAAEQYFSHVKKMTEWYGNIGCGVSWLEIDGRVMSDWDLMELLADDREVYGRDAPAHLVKSKTQKAREMMR